MKNKVILSSQRRSREAESISDGKKKTKNPMKDYLHWEMKPIENLLWLLFGFLTAGILSLLFTRSFLISIVTALVGSFFIWKYRREQLRQKVRRQLNHEFRESLSFMMTLIRSGRSAEGMIEALSEDLDPLMFPYMYEEIRYMKRGIENHQNVESLFMDLGERSGSTDILDFAGILNAGKRTRGNLQEIMQHSIRILEEKMEVQEEMEVLLAGKKLEQNIMNLTPFLLLMVLYVMNPGYLEPLYSTVPGQMMIVVCIVFMFISFYWTGRIMRIEF